MRHQLHILPFTFLIAVVIMVLTVACEDETSKIGPSLAKGEVTITIDSITWDLCAGTSEYEVFDSKSGNLLLGNLDVDAYGSLKCSFVTRFMCAPTIDVPDSLLLPERVDSCKFVMAVYSGNLTGDSLSPQKVTVYRLTNQLPADINNQFNPDGYYDQSTFLGSKSFIVSNIANPDSTSINQSYVSIDVPLDVEFGKSLFEQYKKDPSIFQWPQSFAQYLPGFYVAQTFGKGCVANIAVAYVAVYYHTLVEETTINDTDTVTEWVHQRDSVIPLMVSPEVLSSNMVNYRVSQTLRDKVNMGENILTTPCGFRTGFKFPAEGLISRYETLDTHLSTISDLTLTIPAEAVDNSLGLSVAPNLLLIKTSEIDDFFAQNKVPDGLTSFTAIYDSTKGVYEFQSMRSYITDLLKKDSVEDDDVDFTIMPVEISYETVTNSYYGTSTSYVTKCVPYTTKPTVTRLLTDQALIVFSFTSQMFVD